MTSHRSQSSYPLAGIRVLELARILAGPLCGQILADLGADVIKVESAKGDDTRDWGPPFFKNAAGDEVDAAYYHSCNRGKRSMVLDFTKEADRNAALLLAEKADIIIENFKVGGLKKYGLDYDAVKAINPKIIYCSITGFGQDGPYAHRPGYDFIIQAMGGFMELTGDPQGEPQKAGIAYSDVFTGTYSALAIQSALIHRMNTGQGQQIDMALLDSQVGVLVNQAMAYFASGTPPRRIGNAHQVVVPYQVFEVSDGHLIIAVGNNDQFQRLCALMKLPEIAADPKFATNADRVRNREDLIPALTKAVLTWKRDELLEALEKNTIPGGPINRLDDVFNDPQVRARQMQVDLPTADTLGGAIPSVRTPVKFSKSALRLETASPRLGEHTDEILTELGLTNDPKQGR